MPTLTPTAATDLFRRPPDAILDVGDAGVAHRRVGSGPDVLLVHGWPVSGATFRTLLPHLVDDVTCHVIDLPGAGDSRFDDRTEITLEAHVRRIRQVIDLLDLDDVAVVGHDSGGLMARHAVAGDERLRALGLVNTEQPQGLSWRFRTFLMARHVPRFGAVLGWAVQRPRLRRVPMLLGDAFADASLLDGEFDELILQRLARSSAHQRAAERLIRAFDTDLIHELAEVHRRIEVPVHLVWGDQDPFFPIGWAREMVGTFPDARLTEIRGGGLFVHEERPAEVAAALLPTLVGGR